MYMYVSPSTKFGYYAGRKAELIKGNLKIFVKEEHIFRDDKGIYYLFNPK